jgi:hypothetical protein
LACWGAEGAGAHWPGGDAALAAIVPLLAIAALCTTSVLRTSARRAEGILRVSGEG